MADIHRAKNELQEFFQKKQLPLPRYSTRRIGGADHAPLWLSIITLYNGTRYDGKPHKTKGEAEASAAFKVLEDERYLSVAKPVPEQPHITTPEPMLVTSNSRAAILVDIENMPKFIDSIRHRLKDFTVYAFVGEHHCLVDKLFPAGVIRIISPSTRADGTDTCMQVYIGMLLAQDRYDRYYIATRDHYGSALVEMITAHTLGWKGKFAKLVTKENQL